MVARVFTVLLVSVLGCGGEMPSAPGSRPASNGAATQGASAAATSDGITIRVRMDSIQYLGQAILVDVTVRNDGDVDVGQWVDFDPNLSYEFRLRDGSGKMVGLPRPRSGAHLTLKRGEESRGRVDLSRVFRVAEPGRYVLSVGKRVVIPGRSGASHIQGPSVMFNVEEADRAK